MASLDMCVAAQARSGGTQSAKPRVYFTSEMYSSLVCKKHG